jgi:hypothetical protein
MTVPNSIPNGTRVTFIWEFHTFEKYVSCHIFVSVLHKHRIWNKLNMVNYDMKSHEFCRKAGPNGRKISFCLPLKGMITEMVMKCLQRVKQPGKPLQIPLTPRPPDHPTTLSLSAPPPGLKVLNCNHCWTILVANLSSVLCDGRILRQLTIGGAGFKVATD